MNCTNLEYENETFDLVLDKSTMDAIVCASHAYRKVAMMLREVQRVLKTGGIYILITFGEPSRRMLHLEREHLDWDIKHQRLEGEEGSKDGIHHVYICRKNQGAEQKCASNWKQVLSQVKKEEAEIGGFSSSESDDEEKCQSEPPQTTSSEASSEENKEED